MLCKFLWRRQILDPEMDNRTQHTNTTGSSFAVKYTCNEITAAAIFEVWIFNYIIYNIIPIIDISDCR